MDFRKLDFWQVAYFTLLPLWIAGAALNMARYNGGFLTNYLADVAFPPWYYIFLRGLHRESKIPSRIVLVGDWFGRNPERTLIGIFLVGLLSEVKTFYWPRGVISGTYDPLDIIAYLFGLTVCYYFDKRRVVVSKPDAREVVNDVAKK